MKYLNYDNKTGKVLGFYTIDIHGDNIPDGCIKISDDVWQQFLIKQDKYELDLDKASNVKEDYEIDKFGDLFIDIITPITDIQDCKISELSYICNNKILEGFYSNSDGTNKLYDFEIENQVNINTYKTNIVLSRLYGNSPIEVISYYAKGESPHDYTSDQLLKLASDADKFKEDTISKYKGLKAMILACTTKEEVEAIIWDTEILN